MLTPPAWRQHIPHRLSTRSPPCLQMPTASPGRLTVPLRTGCESGSPSPLAGSINLLAWLTELRKHFTSKSQILSPQLRGPPGSVWTLLSALLPGISGQWRGEALGHALPFLFSQANGQWDLCLEPKFKMSNVQSRLPAMQKNKKM